MFVATCLAGGALVCGTAAFAAALPVSNTGREDWAVCAGPKHARTLGCETSAAPTYDVVHVGFGGSPPNAEEDSLASDGRSCCFLTTTGIMTEALAKDFTLQDGHLFLARLRLTDLPRASGSLISYHRQGLPTKFDILVERNQGAPEMMVQ